MAPGDTVPWPGSSPAICHPQPRIKRADVPRPPAEMPAGQEGKLRQEEHGHAGGWRHRQEETPPLDLFFLK